VLLEGGHDTDRLAHLQVQLLVNLERFKDALRVHRKYNLGGKLAYEAAYSLYRLGRHTECLALVDKSVAKEADKHRMSVLRAQTATMIFDRLSDSV